MIHYTERTKEKSTRKKKRMNQEEERLIGFCGTARRTTLRFVL